MIYPSLVMLCAGGLLHYPAFAPSSSETVTIFIFFGSKITVDGDSLLLGSYDQPRQRIKKQRLLYQQRSV